MLTVWRRRQNASVVHAGGIQSLLEECDSDVLLLYDCCHAYHPPPVASDPEKIVVSEVLAACGFESTAAEVGDHSFTKNLREALAEAFNDDPNDGLKVVDLHTRLISRLQTHKSSWQRDKEGQLVVDKNSRPVFEPVRRRTPVHYWLSRNDRSIVLAPLREPHEVFELPSLPEASSSGSSEDSPGLDSQQTSVSDVSSRPEPHVLLIIRLEEDKFNVDEWSSWLSSAPKDAKELVKVEGVFGSFSTTVLLRVPVSIWDMFPESHAVTFIDFVTTPNLVGHIEDSLLERQLASIDTRDDLPANKENQEQAGHRVYGSPSPHRAPIAPRVGEGLTDDLC